MATLKTKAANLLYMLCLCFLLPDRKITLKSLSREAHWPGSKECKHANRNQRAPSFLLSSQALIVIVLRGLCWSHNTASRNGRETGWHRRIIWLIFGWCSDVSNLRGKRNLSKQRAPWKKPSSENGLPCSAGAETRRTDGKEEENRASSAVKPSLSGGYLWR